MAFIECSCFSDVLGKSITFWAILPQNAQRRIGIAGRRSAGKHPVMYLLHGLSDDHTIWLRRTSIDRYAEEAGIAVIMPAVDRSFYTDMAFGYDYWKFISQEIPALAAEFFPVSEKREDSFVAGLSMGGYGAFKLGLRMPERFAAVASLSGALDMVTTRNTGNNGMEKDLQLVYGDAGRMKGSMNDLVGLVKRTSNQKGPKTRFYQWCGTEDFLYQENINFRKAAQKAGLPLTYEEGPGGHEWKCWDTQIQRVISWLPRRKDRRN